MTEKRLTGAQAVVHSLVTEGIETIFALPGVQLDYLFDALFDVRDSVQVIHTRHEQATAYMADGYARTTGKVGTCLVVPGPGLLNATAALSTAYACSSPVLCLTGQVDSRGIDAGYGLLHEVPHQDAVLASVTKWTARAHSPAEVPPLVRDAFQQLRSGRPRPVGIEFPPDILASAGDVQLASQPSDGVREPGDPDLVQHAAELLRTAGRPVIYSGGGTLAAGAWDELQSLAELLEAPVVMSVDGRGAISDRHDLAHTGVSGEALVREAAVILAVGTRFWQPARVWGPLTDKTVIRIDADETELNRHGACAVGIRGDAKLVLASLRDILDGIPSRASRREELRARKTAATEILRQYQPQAAFAAAIRAALPDDAIVVNDLTQVTFFATVGLPVYTPRTFIGAGYQGTLGSGFTIALGAQVGNPERSVVAIAGDGGFMYTLGELATQHQHAIPVVSIVFNDGAFGNVKRTQEQAFGGRLLASDLVNPDFAALAKTFGIDAACVETPTQLESALRTALAARRPALIEVRVGPMSNVWPVIIQAGGVYPLMLA